MAALAGHVMSSHALIRDILGDIRHHGIPPTNAHRVTRGPTRTMKTPKRPPVAWVDYTPQLAAETLERNTKNRTLRQAVMSRYMRDMINGNWQLNGDTIKIATDGEMIDGQHRLEAIKQAGDKLPGPIPILTVTELDRDAVMGITDTGLRRLPADALHLQGYKNAASLSAMARGVIRLQTGREFKGGGGNTVVSNSEMLDWLKENPTAEGLVSQHGWMIRKAGLTQGPGLTAYWFLHHIDAWRAAEFIHQLATLEGLGKGSPVAALARSVNRIRVDRTHIRQKEWTGMIFQTWNAWLAESDEPMKYPKVYGRDDYPWPLSRDEALQLAEDQAVALESRYGGKIEQDSLPVG